MNQSLRSVLMVALAAGGCAAPEPEANGPDERAGDQAKFTRTVYVIGDQEEQLVSTETVTKEEIARMVEQREARAAAVTSARPEAIPKGNLALAQGDCNDDRAMWFFDQPGLAGNQLCLIRGGDKMEAAGLINFPRPGFRQNWAAKVRSFFSGLDPGYFRIDQEPYNAETFGRFQRTDAVSNTVKNGVVIAMTEIGATRGDTFFGWGIGQTQCSPVTLSVSEGGNSNIIPNVRGQATTTPSGTPACLYVLNWPLKWGVTTSVNQVGGSCTFRMLEDSILKPPGSFFPVTTLHFYNGTCTTQEP